jgi:hypothetical protein
LSVREEEVKEWTFWESDQRENCNRKENHNKCLVMQCTWDKSNIIPRNSRSGKSRLSKQSLDCWQSHSDCEAFSSTTVMKRKTM